MPDIIQVIIDQNLLGPWFSGPSWSMWHAVLKATYALPMSNREIELFRSVADRDPPKKQVREAWFIIGRRGGKDSVASAMATHAATTATSAMLRPGELATVLCLACDRAQAQIILRYIGGYFAQAPLLKQLVIRDTADGIELSNGVEIVVSTNSYRAVRGRTLLCAILDEAAFYPDDDSASSDKELYAALSPGLSTLPGAMLIGISTPHKRSGLLYEKWRDHYGQNDDSVLVIRGPSKAFNPLLDQKIIDEALARDPQQAAAEWMAEWRTDISGFLDPAWIDRAATLEAGELPPREGISYFCFIDPSGGRNDAMTMGIAHREEETKRVIVDLVRGRKAPFDPSSVVAEFVDVMKRYGITKAKADRYAAAWTTSAFAEPGRDITLEPSDKSKSEIYLEIEPLFSQGSLAIPADRTLLHELRNLERRTHRGGRDSVDHSTLGSHDDFANAMAGAAQLAASEEDGLAVWIRLAAGVDLNPSRGALLPEQVPSPDQLFPLAGVPHSSAMAVRLAARRGAMMISTMPGEATVLMEVPKDIFIMDGPRRIYLPQSKKIEIPLRIARIPHLANCGARILDGDPA